jgi:hypothetical protein
MLLYDILRALSKNPSHGKDSAEIRTWRDELAGDFRLLQKRQKMIVWMIDQEPDLMSSLLQPHRQRGELPLRPTGAKAVNKTEDFQKLNEKTIMAKEGEHHPRSVSIITQS